MDGLWEMMVHPLLDASEISCSALGNDEIGHVTLIPVGEHKGRLLVWTRFDNRPVRELQGCPYKSHILSLTLSGWEVVESMSFDPALPSPWLDDGPFCAGHTWMLDSNGQPRFLLAGGLRHNQPNSPPNPASSKVIWFDPLDTTDQWWFDTPGDLPAPSWYPSVIQFLDPTQPVFRLIAVGGSDQFNPVDCDTLYTDWWTMSAAAMPTWSTESTPNTPRWQGYPRTFLTASATGYGRVLMAGLDHGCDDDENPCRIIDTGVVPQQHEDTTQTPDPNDVTVIVDEIEYWNNSQPALLHTLNDRTFTENPQTAVGQYDLNRIIVTGGTKREAFNVPAYAYTLLYNDNDPAGDTWVKLADAPEPRVFANFTLLPDATILLTGGQSRFARGGSPDNEYWNTAARYDPDANTWTTLATRQLAPGEDQPAPRGYHSVAILLPDGSVVLMGGQHQVPVHALDDVDTEDSLERFLPPYLFKGSGPVLGQVPATIRYGQVFTASVLNGASWPSGGPSVPIERFCLMGVGSVTHHFDYGQRYVELLFEDAPPPPGPGNPSSFSTPKRVLAPPVASMAPEGHYLLFAVDALGRPSKGKFVKLTF